MVTQDLLGLLLLCSTITIIVMVFVIAEYRESTRKQDKQIDMHFESNSFLRKENETLKNEKQQNQKMQIRDKFEINRLIEIADEEIWSENPNEIRDFVEKNYYEYMNFYLKPKLYEKHNDIKTFWQWMELK